MSILFRSNLDVDALIPSLEAIAEKHHPGTLGLDADTQDEYEWNAEDDDHE